MPVPDGFNTEKEEITTSVTFWSYFDQFNPDVSRVYYPISIFIENQKIGELEGSYGSEIWGYNPQYYYNTGKKQTLTVNLKPGNYKIEYYLETYSYGNLSYYKEIGYITVKRDSNLIIRVYPIDGLK